MKRTFVITDHSNVYEVIIEGITILQVIKYYLDSPLQREVHFNNLTEEVQELIIDKIKELNDE